MSLYYHTIKLISLITILFALQGCSQITMLLKASPAERAGFIPNAVPLTSMRERSPFHGSWFKNKQHFYARRSKCKKLHFPPVRTDYLLEKGWWTELNTLDRSSYESDVKELARFFDQEIREAFNDSESDRWEIVDTPDKDTLIMQFALVEVVATKVHINAIGTGLGLFVTGGGLLSSTAGGSIAFEAQLYDGQNGELLVAFADREADKISVASLRDYQFYAHARQSIRDWSEQIVELAHSNEDTQVSDSLPATLLPW